MPATAAKLTTAQAKTIAAIRSQFKAGDEFSRDSLRQVPRFATMDALVKAGLVQEVRVSSGSRSVTKSYNFGRTKRYDRELYCEVLYKLV